MNLDLKQRNSQVIKVIVYSIICTPHNRGGGRAQVRAKIFRKITIFSRHNF